MSTIADYGRYAIPPTPGTSSPLENPLASAGNTRTGLTQEASPQTETFLASEQLRAIQYATQSSELSASEQHMRTARVQTIKEDIHQGRFTVDNQLLASKMLNFFHPQ